MVFAGAWVAYAVPLAINDGARGLVLATQSSLHPVFTVALLVASVAAVRASRLRGRTRSLALAAAAMAVAALAGGIIVLFMISTGLWSPPWPWSVIWWFNFGSTSMICIAAALIEDHRTQGLARSAALRDARQRAADVVRRTAAVRVQAARARVEPRFLFDALSAVERTYDADPAAGSRLLDDLVTYLRAVVPDLDNAQSTVGRELEIARLWLAIRRAIAGATEADRVADVDRQTLARPFPCMTLTDLTEAMLDQAPPHATVVLDAGREGQTTVVRVGCSLPGNGDVAQRAPVQALRARLFDLYGDRGRVTFARGHATVEIDDEASESRHR
ncbi:MAG: histidine kinase [Burkholderiales bacterium]